MEPPHSATTCGGTLLPDDDGQRQCARDQYCFSRVIDITDGVRTVTGALTPRIFCDRCRDHIKDRCGELPAAYERLAAELGEPARRGEMVRTPFGPRLPLRENVDVLMRLMASTLCGWECRVRSVARLTPRDPYRPVDTAESVEQAASTLVTHLDVLLALQPKWMTRAISLGLGRHGEAATIPAATEELHGDREIVRLGVDFVALMVELGAQDAGQEILRLHYRALAVLGEVTKQPETLDGVPCRRCEDMSLERAEPPSDPSLPVQWSVCATCHDHMSQPDYAAWAALYASWADGSGLTCQRCSNGDCRECVYAGCACTACHAAA
jgi:hypothetical protein